MILNDRIDDLCHRVETDVIRWRRDIHEHPEMANDEIRTAELVDRHLRSLGIETKTGVAHTGVVGLLEGKKDGPVIALRADMDALPVAEEVDLPFASKVRSRWNGQDVGVMHACGHDAHTAILMGVASVLSELRDELPGAVKLIFQPAEEGAPEGEEGGAELMVREGVLDDPRPAAIFGLHVTSGYETGSINVRPGALMAAIDSFRVRIRGSQTHAAYPWRGIDPIVVASQIILGLQTIPSRQLNSIVAPAVVSVGAIHGGVRENIIPDEVEMMGTLRTLDPAMRDEVRQRVRRTMEKIAESAGATIDLDLQRGYPVVMNDAILVDQIMPVFRSLAGESKVEIMNPVLGGEDFAFFQQEIPGVFFFLGTRPPGLSAEDAAPNHSPRFFVDEAGLGLGVRSLAHVAADRLTR